MHNEFGWRKGEGDELKSLTFASEDRELLCSITMLASGQVKSIKWTCWPTFEM